MQDLPTQMHPRYPEFLEFMRDCPHRKTPATLETAFWAWINSSNECLRNDLNTLHRQKAERDREAMSLVNEIIRLEDENIRLNALIDTLKKALSEVRDE